jgi:hypothetical protein
MKLEMKTTTTVKNSVRRRIIRTAAGLAVAALLGIGVFFYGNIGNNTETLASNKNEQLSKVLKNVPAPSRSHLVCLRFLLKNSKAFF